MIGGFDFITLNSADNDVARGIWSNGTTMWVADFADKKLYAYDMGTRNRAGTADFDTLIAAGLLSAFGIAGDGTTMWVIDAFGVKVYAFNQPSSDAALSALAVSPDDIAGFDADDTSYEVGVASTVEVATVTASANHAAAEVAYSGADADLVAAGYQVSLSAGRNAVTVTVTAEDGSTRDYTLSINRAVAAQYGWNAEHDLDGLIAAGNRSPRGIWANSSTFYISDADARAYAYNRDGTRDSGKEFNLSALNPEGIWSDGTFLWVALSDSANIGDPPYLSAIRLSNGAQVRSVNIDLGNVAVGVWGNAATVWAVDETTDKLEAYQKSGGAVDDDKDITLHSDNADPAGIWSNGATMWVADHADHKLYAYALTGGARDSAKDIDTSGSGNDNPRGLWGDGQTIWVTSEDDDKVYAYNLMAPVSAYGPPLDLVFENSSGQLALSWDAPVAVSGETITGYAVRYRKQGEANWLDWTRTSAALTTSETVTTLDNWAIYEVEVAALNQDSGLGSYARIDAAMPAPVLTVGDLTGNRATASAGGLWSDGTTLWLVDNVNDVAWGFALDTFDSGTRAAGQDLDVRSLISGRLRSQDMCTGGSVTWVSDDNNHRLHAFERSGTSWVRAASKDIDTGDGSYPEGLWCDSGTLLVEVGDFDDGDNRVEAYRLPGRTREPSRDIDVSDLSALSFGTAALWGPTGVNATARVRAVSPHDGSDLEHLDIDNATLAAAGIRRAVGIWSDGTHVWLSDDRAAARRRPHCEAGVAADRRGAAVGGVGGVDRDGRQAEGDVQRGARHDCDPDRGAVPGDGRRYDSGACCGGAHVGRRHVGDADASGGAGPGGGSDGGLHRRDRCRRRRGGGAGRGRRGRTAVQPRVRPALSQGA